MVELNITLWNARSVFKKVDELSLMVSELNIDIILITETQLNSSKTLNIPGFLCYRKDRTSGGGGGVAILIHNSIKHEYIETPHTSNLETVAIQIPHKNTEYTLVSAYNPPNKSLLATDIDLLLGLGKSVIIGGDFNAKHQMWNCCRSNRNGKNLFNHLQKNDFNILHPDSPTHYPPNSIHPSTLDLVLTKNSPSISLLTTEQLLSSDHLPVFFSLGGCFTRTPRTQSNFTLANWKLFKSHINQNIHLSSNTLKSSDSIDHAVSDLTQIILAAGNLAIPKVLYKPFTIPLSPDIKLLISTKNRLRKHWQKTKDRSCKTLINSLNREIQALTLSLKNNSWSKKLQSLTPSDNSLWRTVKSIRNKTSPIPPLDSSNGKAFSDSDKANVLADSFSKSFSLPQDNPDPNIESAVSKTIGLLPIKSPPVTIIHPSEISKIIKSLKPLKAPGVDLIKNIHLKNLPHKAIILLTKIFNGCLISGYFPVAWKVALVIPIKKSGKDHSNPVNYRPISMLSAISKVLEKIILNRLSKFHEKIIIPEQFGFRRHHSTVQQLTRITLNIENNLKSKITTGMVLIDIEKAFDTVWHDGLLHKLFILNTPDYVLNILKSYLSDRKFTTVINNSNSSLKLVTAGVPQGSLLGPYLFSLYINDVPTPPRCNLALYADDTACFTSSKRVDHVRTRLQKGLTQITSFFAKWKLKVNSNKTEAILFTNKRQSNFPPKLLTIAGSIEWSKTVKYLGLLLDSRLRWGPQTEAARCKGLTALGALTPIFSRKSHLSQSNKNLIYNTLIKPTITYSAPSWFKNCRTNFDKLQVIQNKAIKIIHNTPFRTNLKRLHSRHNIPTIQQHFQRLALQFYTRTKTHTNPLIRSLGDSMPMLSPPRQRS